MLSKCPFARRAKKYSRWFCFKRWKCFKKLCHCLSRIAFLTPPPFHTGRTMRHASKNGYLFHYLLLLLLQHFVCVNKSGFHDVTSDVLHDASCVDGGSSVLVAVQTECLVCHCRFQFSPEPQRTVSSGQRAQDEVQPDVPEGGCRHHHQPSRTVGLTRKLKRQWAARFSGFTLQWTEGWCGPVETPGHKCAFCAVEVQLKQRLRSLTFHQNCQLIWIQTHGGEIQQGSSENAFYRMALQSHWASMIWRQTLHNALFLAFSTEMVLTTQKSWFVCLHIKWLNKKEVGRDSRRRLLICFTICKRTRLHVSEIFQFYIENSKVSLFLWVVSYRTEQNQTKLKSECFFGLTNKCLFRVFLPLWRDIFERKIVYLCLNFTYQP